MDLATCETLGCFETLDKDFSGDLDISEGVIPHRNNSLFWDRGCDDIEDEIFHPLSDGSHWGDLYDFRCVRRPNPSGPKCTVGANDQSCQNGGAASGTEGNCACICSGNFVGSNCQTAGCATGSNGLSCQNGATSSGTAGSCSCICTSGFSGVNCEIGAACTTAADGRQCQNGGTVFGTTGVCGCSCLNGYSGK